MENSSSLLGKMMRNFGRILIVAVSLKLHKHLLHSIKAKLRFGTHHPITMRFSLGGCSPYTYNLVLYTQLLLTFVRIPFFFPHLF